MQYDYSFHHRDDRVNNTLSYGLQFADVFALWADYVHDTKYEFSQEKISILVDYYLDGICKMMVYGKYPDLGAKNRSISRKEALQAMGTSIVEKLAKVTDYRKNELQKIIESRKYGRFTPEFLYSKFFWCSEYYSHQCPAFFTSVRMFSQRNCNMEVPYNGEGLLNHHLGDGANYVYVEGTEYYDIFPVFDWQKIPGTTIVQKPELIPEKDIQKWGLTTFVGGVTDGSYGVTAFDFISPHDSTKAKKSWFFFDNEYVCLGSGIESDKNYLVVTTLNQSHLKGDVIVSVDNKKQILKKGNRQIKNVQYVYHNNIGYFFQIPTAINLSNQIQEGSWLRINRQSDISDEKVAMEVFKLWIDHGINPKNATYEYIVMPAITSNEFEKRIDNRDIQILSNTTNIQSVKHRKLNIIQAVFYKPGLLNISQGNYLKCEDPCLIMLSFNGEKLVKISASDPNRNLESINFSLPIKIEKKQDNFFSKWDDNNKRSDISIRLPSGVYQGESITIYL
jgi:chondroitin AC lyase